MKRARLLLAATLVTTASAAAVLAAQATQAPQQAPRRRGCQRRCRRFSRAERSCRLPGARSSSSTRRRSPGVTGRMSSLRLQVKNVGRAPISRLTFTETWYDKAGVIVTGNKGVINGLFQPGEIQTLTISTPYDARMSGNRQGFSHANGTVKTTRVAKFDAPKRPRAAAAAATKKPAAAAK